MTDVNISPGLKNCIATQNIPKFNELKKFTIF